MNDFLAMPTYCNLCKQVFVQGFHCDTCCIYVDEKCLKKADRDLTCKKIIANDITQASEIVKPFQHLWIRGNLPLKSRCCECDLDCGTEPKLVDYKCVWCWRTIDEKCYENKQSEVCDFGPYKNFIINPNMLSCSGGTSSFYHKRLVEIHNVKIDWNICERIYSNINFTPMIVFANKKSGGSDADHIMSQFRAILNPLQVTINFFIYKFYFIRNFLLKNYRLLI